MTIRAAAPLLGISTSRLRKLCREHRVRGARLRQTERGPVWSIPAGQAGRPVVSVGERGPLMKAWRNET